MTRRKLTSAEKKELAARRIEDGYKIVAAGVVGNIVYLAVRDRENENTIFPAIIHVDKYGDTEVLERCMFDDDCLRCPESILKEITDDFYGGEWVAECRENNARKKAETEKNAKLKSYPCGTVIRFTFKSGESMMFTKRNFTNNESFPIQICVSSKPRIYWVNDKNQKIDPKCIPVNYEVIKEG